MLPLRLVLLAAALTVVSASCPNGWSRFRRTCYRLYSPSDELDYKQAKRYCKHIVTNGKLAVPKNQEENTFVKDLLPDADDPALIGVRRGAGSHNFRRAGDKKKVKYFNWGPLGAPGRYTYATCVVIWGIHGHWLPTACDATYQFVCQAPMRGKKPVPV